MRLTPKMQELADKVLKDMEKGSLPWEMPWFYQQVMNWKSKRPYQGMNVIGLAYGLQGSGLTTGQFVTYKQATEAGGQVKKGAKGFCVSYFQMLERMKDGKKEKFPLMKTSVVFSLDQVDGLKPHEIVKRELKPNVLGDKIILLSGAKIIENGATTQTPAFCKNDASHIEVPKKSLWKTDEGYYSTVFHELIHWTGAKERLNRPSFTDYKAERPFEELVAEMGGAFLSAYVGFHYDTQHTAYITSWCKGMKEKEDTLYKACSQAQKAVNMLLQSAGEIKTPVPEGGAVPV
jgi:antirestriction protein ArdC